MELVPDLTEFIDQGKRQIYLGIKFKSLLKRQILYITYFLNTYLPGSPSDVGYRMVVDHMYKGGRSIAVISSPSHVHVCMHCISFLVCCATHNLEERTVSAFLLSIQLGNNLLMFDALSHFGLLQ